MLKMDLCLALGKTQTELLNNLSIDDMIEWLAYKRIKPFGYDVDNRRFGEVCASNYNSAGKSYKDQIKWTDIFQESYKNRDKKQKNIINPVNSLADVFREMASQQELKELKKLEKEELIREKKKQGNKILNKVE